MSKRGNGSLTGGTGDVNPQIMSFGVVQDNPDGTGENT